MSYKKLKLENQLCFPVYAASILEKLAVSLNSDVMSLEELTELKRNQSKLINF